MKFVELIKKLKEGVSAVYVVEGDDAYFRDCSVRAITKACNVSAPQLNETRYDGESLDKDKLDAFFSGLITPPFMGDRRLVRVNDWKPSEKVWKERMIPYLEKPCETTVLLIVNGKKEEKKDEGQGKKREKSVDFKKEKAIVYVDCSKESEETLTQWLFQMARKEGMQIETDAAGRMVRYCNQDAARIRTELKKLRLLCGNEKITRSIVDEVVVKDAEYKIYELTQAASQKNYALFMEITSDLLGKGYDEIAVLSFLASHYKTLLELTNLRGSDEAAAKTLGMKSYAVMKSRQTARRMKEGEVEELYLRLYELSAGARNGNYQKSGALYAAIAKIFFN